MSTEHVRPETHPAAGWRYAPVFTVVLIIVLGTGLSGVAAWAIHVRQDTEKRSVFRERARERTGAIRRHLDGVLEVLHALVGFHDSSVEVTRKEFATFTRTLLRRHRDIASLVWVERIAGTDRVALEERINAEGVARSFQVTERARDGRIVPARSRGEYSVTLYAEPPDGGAVGLGFDQQSDPDRAETLRRSAVAGDVALSAPVHLEREPGQDRTGVLAFAPLYRADAVTGIPSLRGFVGAAIDVGALVDVACESLASAGIEVRVVDLDAPDGEGLLVVRPAPGESGREPSAAGSAVMHDDTIPVGGRQWQVICIGREATGVTASALPPAMLLGGLVVSVLIATNVGGGLSRARIRSLVEQRTVELGRANQRLQDELRERRLSEERMRFLTRELDHRVKNNMAAILAVVDSTLRASGNLKEFSAAFTGRIMAMARLHTILTQTHWTGADLGSLVRQIIEPYTQGLEGRVVAKGAQVTLGPKAVSSVAMALHELATNAAKYGALSSPDGRIEINWQREAGPGGGDQVRLTWHEGGGPPVGRPSRRGFGSELIESAVAFETEGRANLEFAPDGVRCEIVVPLSGEPRKEGAVPLKPPEGSDGLQAP